MMKKPFELEDRVAVYGPIFNARNEQYTSGPVERRVLRIRAIGDDGLRVYDPELPGDDYYVHSKQCRRLVKKPRLRIKAVFRHPAGWQVTNLIDGELEKDVEYEFVEVRKKK